MERPMIVVQKVVRDNQSLYSLIISPSIDPGPAVQAEFVQVATKHALPPVGGCFDVNAITPDHKTTLHFLGGMYVQPDKLNAVLDDLQQRGYKIERAAA